MERPAVFKKTRVQQLPKTVKTSAEARYWQQFKEPVALKQIAKVTDVVFNPMAPHDFAVSTSTRVLIYDSMLCSLKKQISRFQDVAYSGNFRSDGKLMVAGSENGRVQVFDLDSRSVLRTFRMHSGPVHVTRFCSDKVRILSGSDDKTLRSLDVPTERELLRFDHPDYVRCAVESLASADTWISGCYDHVVRCWDTRGDGKKASLTMDHGAAVEAILPLPGGGLVLSAGGSEIKVWDLLAGGRLLHTLSNHSGTITSLCLDGTGSRLLSGSLDRSVKVYDIATYKVTHTIKYTSPVLSVAISPTNTCLVAGQADGTVSARVRVPKANKQEILEPEVAFLKTGSVRTPVSLDERKSKILTGTKRYFKRGQEYTPAIEDHSVQVQRKQALKPYDRLLKRFHYTAALDAVLKTHKASIIVSVLDELVQRAGLRIALSNRDESSLEPLLRFLVKYIANPQYSAILLDTANLVLDMYSSVMGQSIAIDELIMRLKAQIDAETLLHKNMLQLMGALSLILSANAAAAPDLAPVTGSDPADDILPLTSEAKRPAAPMDSDSEEEKEEEDDNADDNLALVDMADDPGPGRPRTSSRPGISSSRR